MQDLKPRDCIGIVAGAGPDAGLTFWRQVLTASRRKLGQNYRGDLDAPRVRIISEPLLGYATDIDANRDRLLETLHGILSELDASCHSIVIACHALQGLAIEAHPSAAGKIVALPRVVCDFVRSKGIGTVGFLGAPSISLDPARSPYGELWAATSVESPSDPAAVLSLILQAKKIGADHPQILEKLRSMASGYDAETVLLACTDFSGLGLSVEGKVIVDVLDLAAEVVTTPQQEMRLETPPADCLPGL